MSELYILFILVMVLFHNTITIPSLPLSRSPDSVAATKVMFNTTWVADEETCLKKETDLQMRLIKTYNQLAASGRQFGVSLPYFRRQDWDMR